MSEESREVVNCLFTQIVVTMNNYEVLRLRLVVPMDSQIIIMMDKMCYKMDKQNPVMQTLH